MYNTINCACIKQILLNMKKADLVKEIEFIRSQVAVLEHGNKRNMFLRLHEWAQKRLEQLNNPTKNV